MTTQPIRQFDNAILYEMQVEDRTGYNFREIKGVCKAASPFIDVYKGIDTGGKSFLYEVLSNIENLENNGYIKVMRRGKFILRIDLTDRGKEYLTVTVFTHQERAGE